MSTTADILSRFLSSRPPATGWSDAREFLSTEDICHILESQVADPDPAVIYEILIERGYVEASIPESGSMVWLFACPPQN